MAVVAVVVVVRKVQWKLCSCQQGGSVSCLFLYLSVNPVQREAHGQHVDAGDQRAQNTGVKLATLEWAPGEGHLRPIVHPCVANRNPQIYF